MAETWYRQQLVHARPGAVLAATDATCHTAAPDAFAVARYWVATGRPLIVRRPGLTASGRVLCAGLPLPPGQGKRRISVELNPTEIERTEDLPPLEDVAGTFPELAWAPYDALARDIRTAGARVRVVGSFAWQHLTGLPYVTAESDLDLVIDTPPAAWEGVSRVLEPLRRDDLPRRTDIEILLARDRAFSWWEYADGNDTLLVRTTAAVALQPKAEVRPEPLSHAA